MHIAHSQTIHVSHGWTVGVLNASSGRRIRLYLAIDFCKIGLLVRESNDFCGADECPVFWVEKENDPLAPGVKKKR